MLSRAELKRLIKLGQSAMDKLEPHFLRSQTVGHTVHVGKGGVKFGEYVFNGEPYSWVTSTKKKSEAADIARDLKKKGKKVRIVHTSDLPYNLGRQRVPAWTVFTKK